MYNVTPCIPDPPDKLSDKLIDLNTKPQLQDLHQIVRSTAKHRHGPRNTLNVQYEAEQQSSLERWLLDKSDVDKQDVLREMTLRDPAIIRIIYHPALISYLYMLLLWVLNEVVIPSKKHDNFIQYHFEITYASILSVKNWTKIVINQCKCKLTFRKLILPQTNFKYNIIWHEFHWSIKVRHNVYHTSMEHRF